MPRGRILSRSISSSVRIESMSEFAQLLFDRLVIWSDDFGRMEAAAAFVKATMKPLSTRPLTDFADAIAEMVQVEAAVAYLVAGKVYLFIPKHDEHQSGLHKRTKSQLPDPPADGKGMTPDEYRRIALLAMFTRVEGIPPVKGGDDPIVAQESTVEPGTTQKKTRKRTATHMTPEWRPPDDLMAQLQAEYPAIDVEEALCEFRDWWISEDRLKADWNATFRNRMRDLKKKADGRQQRNGPARTGAGRKPPVSLAGPGTD